MYFLSLKQKTPAVLTFCASQKKACLKGSVVLEREEESRIGHKCFLGFLFFVFCFLRAGELKKNPSRPQKINDDNF